MPLNNHAIQKLKINHGLYQINEEFIFNDDISLKESSINATNTLEPDNP